MRIAHAAHSAMISIHTLIAIFILNLAPPPYTLDPAGISFDAPTAGRYCLTVYQANWYGNHRSACVDALSAGTVRIELPITPGEHAFFSRLRPFVEWGPFDLPIDPPGHFVAWLPVVQRSPDNAPSP